MRKLITIAVVLMAATFSVKALADGAAAAAAAKDGWWIKVNPGKCECNEISFDIGVNKDSAKAWKTWKKGEPAEFDVPAEYRGVAELYIHATVHPEGKNGWFCMMYKDNGVKHFDFDKDEDHQKKQSDTDDECK